MLSAFSILTLQVAIGLCANGQAPLCNRWGGQPIEFGDSQLHVMHRFSRLTAWTEKSEAAPGLLCSQAPQKAIDREAVELDIRDHAWGGIDHWLKVPTFEFSVPWPNTP